MRQVQYVVLKPEDRIAMIERRPFYPKKRMILMCDFDRGGFLPPEMVKRRRVVVLRVFGRIALVVPLSASEPRPLRPFHAPIGPTGYRAITIPVWAKADTLAHVSLERFDRVSVRGENYTERLCGKDFQRVLVAVAHATGTMNLTSGDEMIYHCNVPRESGLEGFR